MVMVHLLRVATSRFKPGLPASAQNVDGALRYVFVLSLSYLCVWVCVDVRARVGGCARARARACACVRARVCVCARTYARACLRLVCACVRALARASGRTRARSCVRGSLLRRVCPCDRLPSLHVPALAPHALHVRRAAVYHSRAEVLGRPLPSQRSALCIPRLVVIVLR